VLGAIQFITKLSMIDEMQCR